MKQITILEKWKDYFCSSVYIFNFSMILICIWYNFELQEEKPTCDHLSIHTQLYNWLGRLDVTVFWIVVKQHYSKSHLHNDWRVICSANYNDDGDV